MLLTVWLKRQEMKVNEVKVFANGMSDILNEKDNKATVEAFSSFFECAFPFAAKNKTQVDQQMVDRMKKEVERGPITFTPISTNPLRETAKKMRLADDYKQRLQERISTQPTRARRR